MTLTPFVAILPPDKQIMASAERENYGPEVSGALPDSKHDSPNGRHEERSEFGFNARLTPTWVIIITEKPVAILAPSRQPYDHDCTATTDPCQPII